ncbi:hypothetical protein SISSUDRAFT_531403 [Sistotremastrum suecicum HHB10207 ss-3]|uniref:BTB domain-containing protein n=1 Tax=Sistotremastrum suecicum HHB10207 ss-3 TaxID=1314776 RepID=A0A166F436_9AGAM|nr:hypothetical protein SISSUDRAFT_531403 [Sistotremastrum suecicum HHB10207 ss-3]
MDSPESPRHVSRSFNNSENDAELVLQSSDNVYFYVHKWPLAKSSAVFKDMLSIGDRYPHSAGETEDEQGLPIVEMTETSATLKALLRFIYPCPNPTISRFEHLSSITDAAFKYDIATVLKAVRMLLQESQFMDSQPLRVYAIAKRYEFRDVEKAAIRQCYGINPASDPSLLSFPEMEYLSARDLHRLLIYRRARANDAIDIVRSIEVSRIQRCQRCQKYGCIWWP